MKMNEEFSGIKNKCKNIDLNNYFIPLKREGFEKEAL